MARLQICKKLPTDPGKYRRKY